MSEGPKGSFRAFAHDMQSLPPFMEQVTKRKTVIEGSLPPLDLAVLRGEFDRYDALSTELQQQASVHSGKLAKLMGKLWDGTTTTLKDLFSINEKLASDKNASLTEMNRLQAAAAGAKDAYMVELDQMKLQLTVTRAALREKEGVLATEQRRNSQMADELRRLRVLVGRFIEGTLETRDGGSVRGGGAGAGDDEGSKAGSKYTPQWLELNVSSRQADVFQLSDEVDELFAKVSHEAQRQDKFLGDMDTLVASVDPKHMFESGLGGDADDGYGSESGSEEEEEEQGLEEEEGGEAAGLVALQGRQQQEGEGGQQRAAAPSEPVAKQSGRPGGAAGTVGAANKRPAAATATRTKQAGGGGQRSVGAKAAKPATHPGASTNKSGSQTAGKAAANNVRAAGKTAPKAAAGAGPLSAAAAAAAAAAGSSSAGEVATNPMPWAQQPRDSSAPPLGSADLSRSVGGESLSTSLGSLSLRAEQDPAHRLHHGGGHHSYGHRSHRSHHGHGYHHVSQDAHETQTVLHELEMAGAEVLFGARTLTPRLRSEHGISVPFVAPPKDLQLTDGDNGNSCRSSDNSDGGSAGGGDGGGAGSFDQSRGSSLRSMTGGNSFMDHEGAASAGNSFDGHSDSNAAGGGGLKRTSSSLSVADNEEEASPSKEEQDRKHRAKELKRTEAEKERKRGPRKQLGAGGRPFGSKAGARPPKVVEAESVAGGHMPKVLRELMTSFPRTMRIPSLVTTLRFTLKLFMEKIKFDELHSSPPTAAASASSPASPSLLTLPQFCYFHLVTQYGTERLADVHLTQLQLAVLHHRTHRRVQLLGRVFGCFDVTNTVPSLKQRDVDFLFRVLLFLRRMDIFTDQAIESEDYQIDVNKSVGMACAKEVFGPVTTDNGAGIANRVATLPPPSESKASKACDLDAFLELMLDKWLHLNELWATHYKTLFHLHCSFFQVVREMNFSKQVNKRADHEDFRHDVPDHDAVLLYLDKPREGGPLEANPVREHRPLEVAMGGMKDPFAALAAKAKAVVEQVFGEGTQAEEGGVEGEEGGGGGKDGSWEEGGERGRVSLFGDRKSSSIKTLEPIRKGLLAVAPQAGDGGLTVPVGGGGGSGTKNDKVSSNSKKQQLKSRPTSPGDGPGVVRAGGSSVEVVPLMTDRGFRQLVLLLQPKKKPGGGEAATAAAAIVSSPGGSSSSAGAGAVGGEGDEVDALFDRGVELAQQKCLASFGHVWRRYEDSEGDAFWHNRWLGTCQWVAPYDSANFRSEDFGLDVFTELCLQERLLERSPFVTLLEKDPLDLWENAPNFLAQLEHEEEQRRLELAQRATSRGDLNAAAAADVTT